MPGARCARSRVCSLESTRVSHHGHTGNTRHSPRNGFNGLYRALPGDRAFLPPSPAKVASTDLTPASGRQDHTTSPSGPVSTKATRRFWYQSRRSFSEGGSASLVVRHCRVHRIPPHVRDDRETPLCWDGTGQACRDDLPDGESGIFFAGGLDGVFNTRVDLPVGQIVWRALTCSPPRCTARQQLPLFGSPPLARRQQQIGASAKSD